MTCAVGFQWSCGFKWGSCISAETIRSRRGFRPRVLQPRTVSVHFHIRCSCVRIVREPIIVDWALWGPMAEEGDVFYVVRKGNTVGVYKSLKDCQSQVWDPTFSVYKGRCLSKEAEEYLAFCGLKNAAYSICSTDLKDDVFGTLVPCSRQEPDGIFSSFDKGSSKTVKQKRPVEVRDAGFVNEASGSAIVLNEHSKHQKLIDSTARSISCYGESLTLQVEQSEKNKNYCGSKTHTSKSRNGVGMMRKKYYVVFKGREQGIYTSWDECQQQVHRHKGACFRAFKTEVEALDRLRAFMEVEREEKQKVICEKALDEMTLQRMVAVARGMHIAYGLKLCMVKFAFVLCTFAVRLSEFLDELVYFLNQNFSYFSTPKSWYFILIGESRRDSHDIIHGLCPKHFSGFYCGFYTF